MRHLRTFTGDKEIYRMITMPYINIYIDLIEEIEKLTIRNKQFDIKKWCLNDAEILIKAGEMIKRELEKKERFYEKALRKKKNRMPGLIHVQHAHWEILVEQNRWSLTQMEAL